MAQRSKRAPQQGDQRKTGRPGAQPPGRSMPPHVAWAVLPAIVLVLSAPALFVAGLFTNELMSDDGGGGGETTVTPSGLRYIDLEVGSGASPQTGQTVVVHYTGWLADGTKFDSSLDRGQPFSFTIGTGQVIPGWDEGVATMKVGGKRRLIIPPELAYGESGVSPVIPPNAELTFDVELLQIQ